MKTSMILSQLFLALTGYAANADQFKPVDYADIDVVSARPRNPDVKPFVMAIFTKEQQERLAAAALKKNAFVPKAVSDDR